MSETKIFLASCQFVYTVITYTYPSIKQNEDILNLWGRKKNVFKAELMFLPISKPKVAQFVLIHLKFDRVIY